LSESFGTSLNSEIGDDEAGAKKENAQGDDAKETIPPDRRGVEMVKQEGRE